MKLIQFPRSKKHNLEVKDIKIYADDVNMYTLVTDSMPSNGTKYQKCGSVNHFVKVCKHSQETEVKAVKETDTD